MSFDEHGFLGNDARVYSLKTEKEYKDYFQLCFDLNEYMQKKKFAFEPPDNNGQKIIAVCLFIRMMNTFQAVYFLAKKGFNLEAQVLVRVIFEARILLKLNCEEEGFFKEYVQGDFLKKLKIIDRATKKDDPISNKITSYANENNLIEELRSKIYVGIKPLKEKLRIKNLAEKANMLEEYDSTYLLLSDAVHTSIAALEKHIFEENGTIHFDTGPDNRDIKLNLISIVIFLTEATKRMLSLFALEEDNELTAIIKRQDLLLNDMERAG
jgi:hypothetical protein